MANPTKYPQCNNLTQLGTRCRNSALYGFKECYLHLSSQEKAVYKKRKSAVEEKTASKKSKSKIKIHTHCRAISETGEECPNVPMIGTDVCWEHASLSEREKWKQSRRKSRSDIRRDRLYNESYTPRKDMGTLKAKKKPKKRYDGFKSEPDGERIVEVENGEVYGFYGGAFLTAGQRDLFKAAPIGDIDDDIKVVRWLIRDALKNQVLFTQAHTNGDIERGFVVFSRQEDSIVDEGGNVISSSSRIIRRKRDYLNDIKALEALVTKMESARIEIKKASDVFDEEIVPFHFNMLPPSNPDIMRSPEELEAIYGGADPQ